MIMNTENVHIANYSIIFMFVSLERYFKKFFFLLDLNNENTENRK